MTGFVLDTFGEVRLPWKNANNLNMPSTMWPDLDPFTQGYVEAMLTYADLATVGHPDTRWRFSDLAPETLAAILKDCQRFRDVRNHTSDGGVFYRDRQAGRYPDFPPLTLTLGDDGKVRFQ